MKRYLKPLLLLSAVFLVGWTFLVDNFLGRPLDITAPTNGQVYKFVSATNKWTPAADAGGAETLALADLTDVAAFTAAVGDIFYVDSIAPTVIAKLARGADGKVLKLALNKPSWADDAGGAETLASSDLTDFSAAKSGTGNSVVSDTSPTITTPILTTPTVNATGTATTVWHGNATGATSFSPVVSADVTDGTLVSADLSSAAGITSAQILNGEIVSADLAAAAGITAGQILDGTLTTSDLNASAGIVGTQLAANTVTLGRLAVAGANSRWLGAGAAGSGATYTENTFSSDFTVTGTALGITANALDAGDLAPDSVAASELADNAVDTNAIVAANVTLAKIANAAANKRVVGSGASGSGASYAELSLGDNLDISGTTLFAAAAPTEGFYRNLVITQTSSTALTVTADAVVLKDSSGNCRVFRTISETITITTAGAQGLEASDSEGASKFYEVHLIAKADGTVDGLLNEAGTAITTVPATYLYSARFGTVRNDGSSNLLASTQIGAFCRYRSRVSIATGLTATSFTAQSLTAAVPPTSRFALLFFDCDSTNTNVGMQYRATGDTNFGDTLDASTGTSNRIQRFAVWCPTDSSQSMDYLCQGGSPTNDIACMGYLDNL